MVSAVLYGAAAAWRDADPDLQTRAELDRPLASGDTAALAERFEGSLAFGTADIRAGIGADPMRMNGLVADRVAASLARYITTKDPGAAAAGVVIGYDGRTNSAVFATDAARILSLADVSVSMLPGPLPTPVLAFTVPRAGPRVRSTSRRRWACGDDIAPAHGLHVTRQRVLRADGAAGLAQLADAVSRVRKEPPRLLAGQPVTVTDLREGDPGVVDLADGHAESAPWASRFLWRTS